MTGRMIGAAIGLLLVLSGCSREDRDLVSYMRIDRSAISSGDTLALESGAPDTTFSWSVVYTAPTSDYWMEVQLADADNNELVLFRKTCDKRTPERYGCGAISEQICSPGPNALYCDGQQVDIDRHYNRLLFKGCVTDAYDRPVCGIEEHPVTLTGLDLPELPAPPSPPLTPETPGDTNPPPIPPEEPDQGDEDDGADQDTDDPGTDPGDDPGNEEPGGTPGGGSGSDPDDDPGEDPGTDPGPNPDDDEPGDDDEDPWWRWDGFPWLDWLFDDLDVPPSIPII